MAVHALRECTRFLRDVRGEQTEHGPERSVLHNRERDCEPPLVDTRALAHGVEREPEQRAVERVGRQAADEPYIRVVAPEDATVKRLL